LYDTVAFVHWNHAVRSFDPLFHPQVIAQPNHGEMLLNISGRAERSAKQLDEANVALNNKRECMSQRGGYCIEGCHQV
jgi:hypothetical protein